MGLGQARPSQGRVVQGFPNTLVDKRTGFVAGIYLKNGSEVVIQFAGLGSQHNGIGQFMRCAFQSLGLWVPKNFAQASKVTQMVQEHLRELNKLRPAGQQYTLALGGHSMGGAMATNAALRNGVPALVTNPLHLGLASRARIGAEAMRRGPELVTEVVVQTDWVSDNRASKLLALTDPMSIALTGDVAHNRRDRGRVAGRRHDARAGHPCCTAVRCPKRHRGSADGAGEEVPGPKLRGLHVRRRVSGPGRTAAKLPTPATVTLNCSCV
jgi:hypothetical protein